MGLFVETLTSVAAAHDPARCIVLSSIGPKSHVSRRQRPKGQVWRALARRGIARMRVQGGVSFAGGRVK